MVFSTFSGVNSPIKVKEIPKQEVSIKQESSKREVIERKTSIEQYVRNYFSDIPVMADIAWCESRFRQFHKNGDIFRGIVNNKDVGVMQINEKYHLAAAEDSNYNIYSIDGNLAYARKIYEKSGTQPWVSSKPCWGSKESLALSK